MDEFDVIVVGSGVSVLTTAIVAGAPAPLVSEKVVETPLMVAVTSGR